jgi:ubiquinone/menaquinone biosynthesis C-methylase UbiE
MGRGIQMENKFDNGKVVKEQYLNSSNLSSRLGLHSYNINKTDWHVWCFDNMKIPAGARVLELGCGNGILWEKNMDRVHKDWDIVLSDLSEGMLRDAQEGLEGSRMKVNFQVVDVQSIPFPDESFDVVIARHMLYHVPDLNAAISEIKRVLKPGGIFYASTNGEKGMMELKHLINEFDTAIDYSPDKYADKFGFKSGEILLKRFFSNISLKLHEGKIVVSEIEPVVNYVKSTIGGTKYFINEARVKEFYDYIKRVIDTNGAINITTSAGLFEVVKE